MYEGSKSPGTLYITLPYSVLRTTRYDQSETGPPLDQCWRCRRFLRLNDLLNRVKYRVVERVA